MRRRQVLKLAGGLLAGGAAWPQAEAANLQPVSIQFTRFSAFYTPVIVLIGSGYLEQEGLKPQYSVAPTGKSALSSLADGSAQVVQSAPGAAFALLAAGGQTDTAHFAQINGRDGFFLVGRSKDDAFSWSKLRGQRLLITFDTQPMTMFRYACSKAGVDPKDIDLVRGGSDDEMMNAFQRGAADYIHLQGPGPQALEKLGAGAIVAEVGKVSGPCAFSTLAASRSWLATDAAVRFTRAYRKACAWVSSARAEDIAGATAHYFDEVDVETLTAAISAYQRLGTWSADVTITPTGFDAMLDAFMQNGVIHQRYVFSDLVVAPPA